MITGTRTSSISLTMSELILVPAEQIIRGKKESNKWAIYNGERKTIVSYNEEKSTVVLDLQTIELVGDWESKDRLEITIQEFMELADKFPDIMECASSRVFRKPAGIPDELDESMDIF